MIQGSLMIGTITNFLSLLFLALVFSWIFRRLKLPPLLGAMIAGLIIGPSFLNLVNISDVYSNQWLIFVGNMGGLILVFLVGLESRFEEFTAFSKEASLVGASGLIFTFLLTLAFSLAVGVSLPASLILSAGLSISTSLPALTTIMSMRKGRTRIAKIFSVSSIVDDIIGLILLFLIISGFKSNEFNLEGIIIYLVLILLFWVIAYLIVPRLSAWIYNKFAYPSDQTIAMLTLVFLALAALISEEFLYEASFGVFLIGLAFSKLHPLYRYEIKRVFLQLGDAFFFPMFFVMIGLIANFRSLSNTYWLLFATSLVVVAVLFKLLGVYIGGFFANLSRKESIAVGLALTPRGGVTLVISSIALASGIITEPIFASIIFTSIATTLITPFLVRIGFVGINK